jgi:hypothetical protein
MASGESALGANAFRRRCWRRCEWSGGTVTRRCAVAGSLGGGRRGTLDVTRSTLRGSFGFGSDAFGRLCAVLCGRRYLAIGIVLATVVDVRTLLAGCAAATWGTPAFGHAALFSQGECSWDTLGAPTSYSFGDSVAASRTYVSHDVAVWRAPLGS